MAKLFLLGAAAMLMRADEATGGYGYGDDTDQKVAPFNFGLNAGKTFLKKFEWIPNGGKEGAEQEALEIIFNINGTDRSYRQFPVTKAFGKNGEEVTDPNSAEMKQAFSDLRAIITHILHAFVEDAAVKKALGKPGGFADFKEYVNTCKSILPSNIPTIALDIFMEYQWKLGSNNTRTFLQIPNKRKHGAFVTKAVQPVGEWREVRAENPQDNTPEALKYVDDNGNVHPFVRNGWYVKSPFANQQVIKKDDEDTQDTSGGAAMNAGTTVAPDAAGGPVATSW